MSEDSENEVNIRTELIVRHDNDVGAADVSDEWESKRQRSNEVGKVESALWCERERTYVSAALL